MQLIIKQQTDKKMTRDLQNNVQFCALHAQLPIWYTIIRQWQHFGTLKIKTLITHLCSLIISDSVAVEIFAIGQPCGKIFRKVRCATFLRHGVHGLWWI